MGYTRAERERMQRLDEQGLCVDCDDNPQNPHITGHVCLDCWKEVDSVGCNTDGCTNSVAGSFEQMKLCEVHLTDVIHSKYHEYLEMKSDIEDDIAEVEAEANDANLDLANLSSYDYRELSNNKQVIFDKWIGVKHRERQLKHLKEKIKSAMESVDQPFPDEYEVFG